MSTPHEGIRPLQVWNEQYHGAEAAHPGECARGRLLRHLRIRCGLGAASCHGLCLFATSSAIRCLRTPLRSWASERPRTRSWPTPSSSSGRGQGPCACHGGCERWGVEVSQVMAYYPLHFVMSVIFAPMFIQVERPGVSQAACAWHLPSWSGLECKSCFQPLHSSPNPKPLLLHVYMYIYI